MGNQITPHFNVDEFTCKCGCRTNNITRPLVEKLEKVYEYLNATSRGVQGIYITSGYRCPRHSVAVGGSADDAHTRGIAADFFALDSAGTRYESRILAAVCEYVGFSGIGVIDKTAVHADIRNATNYKNAHWFGNEMTGNDNIETWREFLPAIAANVPHETTSKTRIKILVDDKTIYEREV